METTIEKLRDSVETAYDKLTESTEKAKALIDAVRELGRMDEAINYELMQRPRDLMKPENLEQYITIAEIIRVYDTIKGLCYTLAGEIDNIIEAGDDIEKAINQSSPYWNKGEAI